jgi:capsular exopolysaccharide synthesis family protein
MSIASSRVSGNGAMAVFRDSEFGFADVWNLLLRHWKLISLSVAIGGALAVAYWYCAPRIYESSSQVLIMRKDSQLATKGVPGSTELESNVSEDLLSTHIQIFQSNRLVKEALVAHELDQLPSIPHDAAKKQSPVEYVVKNLSVTRGGTGQSKGAHVLNIKFRHVDDVDAQRVLSALIEQYQAFLLEKFQDVNKEAAGLISQARLELEEELKSAEAEYLESRRHAPLLWDGDKSTNVHRKRFEEIEAELSTLLLKTSQVDARLEVVESTYAELKAKGASGLEWLSVIDDRDAIRLGAFTSIFQSEASTAGFQSLQPARMQTAQTENTHLLKLMVQEQTLTEEFGPNHPEVIATRDNLKVIREFLRQSDVKTQIGGADDKLAMLDPERIVGSYIKLLKNDKRSLESHIANLTAKATSEENAAKALIDYELDDETRRKELNRKQLLFDAVVERLRDINLTRDYGGFINEVLNPPEVGEKVWPKLLICLVLGVFFGLLIGIGAAVFADFRDRSFRSPEEIADALRVPVLSHLPNLLHNDKKRPLSSPLDATLCSVHRPKSRDAEVFRSLRTALFSKCTPENFKVVGCTSPNQGDGKSTTIANLAVSIAQAGRRVLLIDCDLRRSQQHLKFALENKYGVTDILQNDAEVFDAIQDTAIPGLSLLSAGHTVANPAELLVSPKFAQLVELVRERFDFVLIDTPPVLAVSDPCIVAPLMDLVLLVIRVTHDSRPQVMRANGMLADVGAPILGTILNGWDAPAHFLGNYVSGYSGYSGYYYGTEDNGKTNGYYRDDSAAEISEEVSRQETSRVEGRNGNGAIVENSNGYTNGHGGSTKSVKKPSHEPPKPIG